MIAILTRRPLASVIIIILIVIIIIIIIIIMEFFTVLGRKIGVSSGDDREGSFLFQRLSIMALQRYNAILLHEIQSC